MLVRGFPFNSHHPFRLFPAFVRLSPPSFPRLLFHIFVRGFPDSQWGENFIRHCSSSQPPLLVSVRPFPGLFFVTNHLKMSKPRFFFPRPGHQGGHSLRAVVVHLCGSVRRCGGRRRLQPMDGGRVDPLVGGRGRTGDGPPICANAFFSFAAQGARKKPHNQRRPFPPVFI